MEDEFTEKMHSEFWVPADVDMEHRLASAVMAMEGDNFEVEEIAKSFDVPLDRVCCLIRKLLLIK